MKNIFIDTNILGDLIAERKPFSKYAVKNFTSVENKKIRLYTSSYSYSAIYYLLKKFVDDKTLREILLGLFKYITIIPVDVEVLLKGLRSKQKDFEDSIQQYCATSIEKMDGLITRNIKNFKGSEIPILAPDTLCSKL